MTSDKSVLVSCYAVITCTARTVGRNKSKTKLLLQPRTVKLKADWQTTRQRSFKEECQLNICTFLSDSFGGFRLQTCGFATVRTCINSDVSTFLMTGVWYAFRDEWQTQNSIKLAEAPLHPFLGRSLHLKLDLQPKFGIFWRWTLWTPLIDSEQCGPPW